MKNLLIFVLLFVQAAAVSQDPIKIIQADHPYIQYYGRVDNTNPKAPRFWAPGVYITTRFSGTDCEIFINDQVLGGDSHNYIEVTVDNIEPVRIQLRARANRIQIAKDLPGGNHTVTITKNTDAAVGFLEFVGFKCESLLPPPPVPKRKIEFIGGSVTAGFGSDSRYSPCDSSAWYDQSDAYNSYGPIAARSLNAQWQLTAVSGSGIVKTGEHAPFTLPQVFDKIDMQSNKITWDFKRYQPDLVVICIGEEDRMVDSLNFCNKYRDFLKSLRGFYPVAQLVCISSPMSDEKTGARLRNYISSVVSSAKRNGDERVQQYIFTQAYNSGCSKHPNLEEHVEIALELTTYLKKLMAW
jgi:hypothetical protein